MWVDNNNKSPGPDDITTEMLVAAGYVGIIKLTKLDMLQTTQPISGGNVTEVENSCANCVKTSRPQQWGPDIPFLGKPAMRRTRWMASAAPHKSW